MPASIPRLLLLLVLLAALPACGVALRHDFDGTELITDFELSGDFVVNGPITVSVEINDAYPVPVRLACYYEDRDLTDDERRVIFHERAHLIGEETLQPTLGTVPADEVEREKLSFTFAIDTPGSYFVACITPAAPENGIGRSFRIRER